MTPPRFYMSELRGYPELTSGQGGSRGGYRAGEGVTFTVHDRAFNCCAVECYRSESEGDSLGRAAMELRARRKAEARCAQLNGDPTAVPKPVRKAYRFRPTCPECGIRQAAHDARTCLQCGAALYPSADELARVAR